MGSLNKLLALFLLAALSFAQTSLTNTTFSSAVSATDNVVNVVSATGIAAPTLGASIGSILVSGKEAMRVMAVTSLRVSVQRGYRSEVYAHASGATVYEGQPSEFANTEPYGTCTAGASWAYSPLIVFGTGNLWNCTSSVWVNSVNQTFAGTADITGNATIGGTLGVTGAATVGSSVVTGAQTVGTTLGVTGASTLASVGVTGAATVGTTLGVTGATTLASVGVTAGATVGTTLAVTGTTNLAGGLLTTAIKSNAINAGTVGTNVTAVEYGNGMQHTTVLTLTAVNVGAISGAVSEAEGALIYTLPAGAVIVKAAYMTVGLTNSDTTVDADTPDMGLGTSIGTGVQALLSGVAGSENILTGQTVNNVTGTAEVKTVSDQILVIETGGDHTVHLNIADGWAGSETMVVAGGTVVLEWQFVQ